jgi:phosphonoacetaldehyde hydrolase
MSERIRLVVFDWAGTTVDFGCFAPVSPFVEALALHGVKISVEQARGPMGLDKKDHVRALLALPEAAAQWRARHGADVSDADVDRIFDDMVPLALKSVAAHSSVIAGVAEIAAELRSRGIRIGSTTGYFLEAARVCFAAAAAQGFAPDFAVCASEVPQARPAPWMMHRNMEALGVYPPAAVLKVGDTVPDILEGLGAGCWSAGVLASSNHMGLAEDVYAALPLEERTKRLEGVRRLLRDAGAHEVVETVRDVPRLVDEIDRRMAAGERPNT